MERPAELFCGAGELQIRFNGKPGLNIRADIRPNSAAADCKSIASAAFRSQAESASGSIGLCGGSYCQRLCSVGGW